MYKKIILTTLILFPISIFCQTIVLPKTDSIDIKLNDINIKIAVPLEGKKSTLKLQDSTSFINIIIARESKILTPQSIVLNEFKPKKKVTKILSEVYFGTGLFISKNRSQNTLSSDNFNNIYIRLENDKPSINIGVSLKKTERKLRNKLYLETGGKFNLNVFTASGVFESTQSIEILDTFQSSGTNYSIKTINNDSGSMKINMFNPQFIFPLLLNYRISKKYSISLGFNTNITMNAMQFKSKEIDVNKKIVKDMDRAIIYPFIQLQPQVGLTINNLSIFCSYDLIKTKLGYGNTQVLSGNFINFGLGYKLF